MIPTLTSALRLIRDDLARLLEPLALKILCRDLGDGRQLKLPVALPQPKMLPRATGGLIPLESTRFYNWIFSRDGDH